ncbi:hypothetical protein GALMADRAFT_248513 [Galerina marginata CBS 339.88]|uniref:Uncharacterized protein n=1 Tax=Galerina marginata (strain CBS 339.88) TaxID=685588 RepID=A0A067T798_GALM3|nr:hypothetical protein GALMADRAFT_248513 [Galerina marginata CBS 339.88]
MDDSDDYIVDDIVFDDQTLAALDQQEQKYFQESNVTTPSSIPSAPEEPINKRHKTSTGWAPGIGANVALTDSYDDLPEISLHGDGSYAIGYQVDLTHAPISKFPATKTRSEQPSRPMGLSVNFGQANSAPTRNIPSAQASGSRLNGSGQNFPVNTRQRQSFQNTDTRNQAHSALIRQNTVHNTEVRMPELQRKLDELQKENAKIQSALKDAVDLKLAKEGEVSILRKSIEKTSQNHAAQLLQVKAEREKAEQKQAQMQKEMKDEMERLRTQFIFKQQELESSIRKPPASVRAKKAVRDFPSTPLAVPDAMSAWNRGPSQAQTSRTMLNETPVRPSRISHDLKSSPSKQTRKVARLPGFENAFEASPPLRSPSKRDKGKGKANQDFSLSGGGLSQASYTQHVPGPSQSQSHFLRNQTLPQDLNPMAFASGSSVHDPSQVKSENMDVVIESDEEPLAEEIEVFVSINWKAELCRIILTHSHPSTGQITIQRLLGSSQYVHSANDYSASCARILGVIANSAKPDEYEESIRVVCHSFLSLLVTLGTSQQLQLSAISLNLLQTLAVSLPTFQSILLSTRLSLKDRESASVIDVICKVILEHLEPTKTHVHRDEFATDALSLLETLCFRIPPESMHQIEALARNRGVFMLLLHASQPPWLLERSSLLLVLLSTHHDLFKALLDLPNHSEVDLMKPPFIERLCSHLIDSKQAPVQNFKIYILTFFAQLSIAHPDACDILMGSYALIPSLVLHISQLTTPLWEDHESLVSSPETAASFIQALNQSTFLLYHLIFGTDPCLNLRYKLQHAPLRPFNSISHIFVVTFGRLSYCDPPSWVDSEKRQELEYLADIAREILDVVVDGPEGDSVYAAFQTDPEEENTVDEEEMEARLMGVDM